MARPWHFVINVFHCISFCNFYFLQSNALLLQQIIFNLSKKWLLPSTFLNKYLHVCTPRLTELERKCFAYNSRNVLLRIKKISQTRWSVFFLSMCCEKDTEFYRSNGEMLSENNRRWLFRYLVLYMYLWNNTLAYRL